MEEIEHNYTQVNGLKLHTAEIGSRSSPSVVFLHGFPDIWYSWRHQMIAVAKGGFRAIALDHRGYGLSDPPPRPDQTTFSDLIADLLALLDSLNLSKVILVGKDFGSRIVYLFSLLHPSRVSGFITLGVPFIPPSRPSAVKLHSEGSYISRWQERGRAEADFSRFDTRTVVRNIYILFSRSEVPTALENQEVMDIVDSSAPLPPWFTEQDLDVYASLYEKSGFQTAMQVPYRSLNEEFGITNVKIEVPALVIMGGKDYSLNFPGIAEYIKSGVAKSYVPMYEATLLPEGSHFMQEQFPHQVSQLILDFLCNHS
ncbi:epoxide hydrolase A-like [Salvia hispanica]|uniref:epoxide hydrolase A-like n=1 Tax=Salvia hispanica TaxID=49212 RepID=UPI0020091346|nr:epoxide hydrolase A-like [Salvia hispanica]XP_047953658.1 epoxide hydrolase A-like [Salvia hispanica]